LLHSARRDLPAPGLARWLLAVGIIATLYANIAHRWRPMVRSVRRLAAWPAR
jgi:hypothetical protein